MKQKKNTYQTYEKAFIEMFGISKTKLKNLKYQSISAWDSVGHMSLMSLLEKKFKIRMEIDDIVDFSSFQKGKKILKKYKINIK